MSLKNAKAKGTKNEHRSMVLLEAVGYRCTRAAASLGEWDIIGVGRYGVVLCQVKSNRWPSRAEMSRLQGFPAPPMAIKLIHRWRDYSSKPDVWEIVWDPSLGLWVARQKDKHAHEGRSNKTSR